MRRSNKSVTREELVQAIEQKHLEQVGKEALVTLENTAFLQLVQHVSDALNHVLMLRPVDPFVFLADNLRHVCKVALDIEPPGATALIRDMHKMRRTMQLILKGIDFAQREIRRLTQDIVDTQIEMEFADDEVMLTSEQAQSLTKQTTLSQPDWSLDVHRVPVACHLLATTPASSPRLPAAAGANSARSRPVEPLLCRDIQTYYARVLHGAIEALVEVLVDFSKRHKGIKKAELGLLPPLPQQQQQQQATKATDATQSTQTSSNPTLGTPVEDHKRAKPGDLERAFIRKLGAISARDFPITSTSWSLLKKTLFEMTRKLDAIKHHQRDTINEHKRLTQLYEQLTQEFVDRQRFIDRLLTSRMTARTQTIMEGHVVVVNNRKQWIPDDDMILADALPADQKLALQRAERFLMAQDERQLRSQLQHRKELNACIRLQAWYRCCNCSFRYKRLCHQRNTAARKIQSAFLASLYHRATKVPTWCVVGGEVVVAQSIATRASTLFQFYAGKDFPMGNYKRIERFDDATGRTLVSLEQLKDICRNDETCAGFATDGTLKRFVPRFLSQLKPMLPATTTASTKQLPVAAAVNSSGGGAPSQSRGEVPGIYIKVPPGKNDLVATSGIILQVPSDRFGTAQVIFDGTGIVEQVPLNKLRGRFHRVLKCAPPKAPPEQPPSLPPTAPTKQKPNQPTELPQIDSESDSEAEELQQDAMHHRLRHQQQEEPDTKRYEYEDLATLQRYDEIPSTHECHVDEMARNLVIYERKKELEIRKAELHEQRKLQSAIRLQCAWRSKRAREMFRRVLEIRAKERERERQVNQIARNRTDKKKKNGKDPVSGKATFGFVKWF